MAQLATWKQERKVLLDRAESRIRAAEASGRALTSMESLDVDNDMRAVGLLNSKIEGAEKANTITRAFPSFKKYGHILTDGASASHLAKYPQRVFTEEYFGDFHKMLRSRGAQISAAMEEGIDDLGGYAVPIVVDDQIVPLAPQEMAIRRISSVIPTASDIKIPQKASFSVAALKAETATFASTPPTLAQFTLSAFMVGQQNSLSWELAQDVPTFQSFLVDDMVLAQQMLEESFYATGSGVDEPQGLIGNVDPGYGPQEPDGNGNLVSINGLLNTIGTLNSLYHPGASWLMQRATSIIIRKAQAEQNLFYPSFTRGADGTDYLFGYPVAYSESMPAAARGNTPVLFGDFKRGYLIGDRGGSGINVKVLDQVQAQQGLLVLLTYRRTDGRVRLAEAIQSYTISAS
jgi:HK97 family phage major capsid protein